MHIYIYIYIYEYISPYKYIHHDIHVCNIMSKRHNLLPTRTSSFISSAGIQSETFRVAIIDESHIKIEWVHVVVFTEHDLLHF